MLGRADTVSMEAGMTVALEVVAGTPFWDVLVIALAPGSVFTCCRK